MKGEEPISFSCPICGLELHATPHHAKNDGYLSRRHVVRAGLYGHLKWRHIELNTRERSEIADRVCATLEAFA